MELKWTQSSNLEGGGSFVWKTKANSLFRGSRSSPPFSFLGYEWMLLSEPSMIGVKIFLHLNAFTTKNFERTLKFRVTTFIENDGDMNHPILGCTKYVIVTHQVILEFDEKAISFNFPNLLSHGVWSVVCNFHDISPAMLQVWNETRLLSTQTSAQGSSNGSKSKLCAEKCVQAAMDASRDLENLSFDFRNLLEKKIFPDAKLKCGDRTISVHRSILAARSEVFAAMFRNEMVEREIGIVDIPDMDVPVLDSLLNYTYCGKITDLTDDTASNLFVAGDKYAMHGLKKVCSDWMIRNLTEENCCSFLTIADTHSDDAFKDAVISFIRDNPGVLRSEIWLRFSGERLKLANEVYRSFVTSGSDP